MPENMTCAECRLAGRVTLATEVDHIVAHKGDESLFWDFQDNVRALCKSCHSKKTARENGRRGMK